MATESGDGGSDEKPEARPILNDRGCESEDSDAPGARPEALRPDTGNAIDVDAAHDRSS